MNSEGVLGADELKRLELPQVALLAAGRCPWCERIIRAWKTPSGFIAPEAFASLRDKGIDPGTGHLQTCRRKISL